VFLPGGAVRFFPDPPRREVARLPGATRGLM
jgi:hypothetical protein